MQDLLEQRLWLSPMLCAQSFTSLAAFLDQFGFVNGRLLRYVRDDRYRLLLDCGTVGG